MHHHHCKHKCCPLDLNISRWLTPRISTHPSHRAASTAVTPPVILAFPSSPDANNTTAIAEPNDQQMWCCPQNFTTALPLVSMYSLRYSASTPVVAHPIRHKKVQTSPASTTTTTCINSRRARHAHHPLTLSSIPLIDPWLSISSQW